MNNPILADKTVALKERIILGLEDILVTIPETEKMTLGESRKITNDLAILIQARINQWLLDREKK